MIGRVATDDDFDELPPVDFDEPFRLPLASDADLALDVSAELLRASGTKVLEFLTGRSLAAALPAIVPWIVYFYIAAGALHEVVGRAKAAGKSTLIAYLIRALLDGTPFLGQETQRTPVVLLTEQPPSSLRELLARAGLDDREDLLILTWRAAYGVAWPDVVAAAVDECERIGALVLIVDTLPAFAGIRGDAENDAGVALAAIEPLQAAAADGLAVIVVRHERKGGGEVGDSARGSSAFTGAVDVVLRLARQDNPVRPTVRVLSALSRFDDTPPELVIELTDTGYAVLGDQAAVAFTEARTAVLDLLPDETGLTMAELAAAAGGRRTTIQSAIASLEAAGDAERIGTGKRGDPFRYRRTSPVFLSAERSPYGGTVPVGRPAEKTTPDPASRHLEDAAVPLAVAPSTAETIECSDYQAHQTRHRRVGDAWVCDPCTAWAAL